MLTPSLVTLLLSILLLGNVEVGSSSAKHEDNAKRHAKSSRGPNLVGSGQRLHFSGQPGRAYCLVSDPCLHINVLLAGTQDSPGQTWVEGYGLRMGNHTVQVKVQGPFAAQEDPKVSFSFDGEYIMAPATGQVVNSNDQRVRLERWWEGRSAFLITALGCGIRILVFVKKGWTTQYPRLSLDVLDWDKLDAPHGVMGQIFPNRADPKTFALGDVLKAMARTARIGGTAQTAKTQNNLEQDTKSLSTEEAIRRLYRMKVSRSPLDGVPEDYATSGALETDCLYSRFFSEEGAKAPRTRQTVSVTQDVQGWHPKDF